MNWIIYRRTDSMKHGVKPTCAYWDGEKWCNKKSDALRYEKREAVDAMWEALKPHVSPSTSGPFVEEAP